MKAEEEAAKPEEKPVLEEKADEQKKQEETKTDDAAKDDANAQDGNQKDEPQAEPAAEEPAEPVEQAGVPVVQAAAGEVDQYTISCGDQKLTVMLVDQKGNAVKGIAPKNLTIEKNSRESVDDYAADVKEYTYSSAYYYDGNRKRDVSEIAYYDNEQIDRKTYDGWYSVVAYLFSTERSKITNDTLYLVYTQNSEFNADFTVHYVDENGIEIGEKTKSILVENVRSIVFSDYADPIAGYTYWRACYSTANNAEITKAKKSTNYLGGSTYTFYNGSKKLSKPNSSLNTEDINELNDVYLVYVKNGGDPTPGGTTGGSGTATATNTKKAMRNNDGTYDLSLTVSSNVGSASNPAKVDVIYVLDYSASMKESIGSNTSKITAANNAIKSMTESLANDSLINARFSLVKFSGRARGHFSDISGYYQDDAYNDANIQCGWTNDASKLVSSLPNNPSGGTNYQAGLLKANDLLGKARSGATTVVIFVSDGNPTYYYDNDGYTEGNGSNYDSDAMRAAQNEVKKLAATYFFKVGVGKNTNDYNMLKLITGTNDPAYDNSLHAGTKTKPVFEGTNTTALNAAFEEMRGAITSISCTAVNITDTLRSDYAQIVKKADGSPTALRIVVTDGDGKEVKSGEGSVTLDGTKLNNVNVSTINAVYDENAKQIKLNFNPAYQLEENWTYAVIANIEPTARAYEYYCNSKDYPDGEIGEAGTGTHARESGFYCNTNAVLSYNDGESDKTATYAKPVIQVKPGTLKITKSISGLSNDQIADANLTFTIANGTDSQEVKLSEFKPGTDGTYTYEMPYCVPGATYTVAESNMNVEGFDCATKVNNTDGASGSATIEKGETETIAFTNVYTPSTQDLTITKEIQVDGNKYDGAEFNKAEYTFTVHGEKLDKDRTVTVKGAGSEIIRNLPVGSYTITETNRMEEPAKYEFKETDPPQEITLSKENHAVTITNKYETKKYKVYVRKELDGNMYDSSDKFSFTVDGKDGPLTLGKDQTSGAYEVTYGDSFTVKETDDKGYTSTTAKAYKATVNNDGTVSKGAEVNGTYTDGAKSYTLSNITEDIIIVYTNTKQITPPNGIITTIAPYAIMVVLAAGAGVYFVYSRRRRNR